MEKIVAIVNRKPLIFLAASFGYLIIVGFLKWNIHPPMGIIWFFTGGCIGVYFLDVSEVFFNVFPSPFRTIVFIMGFVAVSFFVVTSSGSLLASGLVLSLYLTLILWQLGELQVRGQLNDWYRLIGSTVSTGVQKWMLVGFIVVFIIETLWFIKTA